MLAKEGEAQSGGGEGEGSSARAAAANTGRCVVCLEEPLGAVFIKCGHLCACQRCAATLRGKCPICRRTGPVLDVYFP